ncbi:hypothetical protein ACFLXQ_04655, partial [Chloroflexota bacterium]
MKNRWPSLIVILLLAGLLTLLGRGAIRENIVTPLLYLAWIGQLIFESIPQMALWAVFLMIALIIALKSLARKGPPSRKIDYAPRD